MHNLADRFGTDMGDVVSRIEEASKYFASIFDDPDSQTEFELWYTKRCPVFSFYRIDHVAVLATYKHKQERGNIPTLVVEDGGRVFEFLRQEFNYLRDETTGFTRRALQ